MIVSFHDKETEYVFHQIHSKKLPDLIQKIALRKLIMLDNANGINDVNIPPSNHLEKLKGNLYGRWSIRINDQWRLCFVPSEDWTKFYDVEIIDYH